MAGVTAAARAAEARALTLTQIAGGGDMVALPRRNQYTSSIFSWGGSTKTPTQTTDEGLPIEESPPSESRDVEGTKEDPHLQKLWGRPVWVYYLIAGAVALLAVGLSLYYSRRR